MRGAVLLGAGPFFWGMASLWISRVGNQIDDRLLAEVAAFVFKSFAATVGMVSAGSIFFNIAEPSDFVSISEFGRHFLFSAGAGGAVTTVLGQQFGPPIEPLLGRIVDWLAPRRPRS